MKFFAAISLWAGSHWLVEYVFITALAGGRYSVPAGTYNQTLLATAPTAVDVDAGQMRGGAQAPAKVFG